MIYNTKHDSNDNVFNNNNNNSIAAAVTYSSSSRILNAIKTTITMNIMKASRHSENLLQRPVEPASK